MMLAVILATMATIGPARPENPETHRYAIVVGYNQSADGTRPALRFADDDAARFYEMIAPLTHRAYLLTEFDETSQGPFASHVRIAEPPRLDRLRRIVDEVHARIEEDIEAGRATALYFFYSGHGDIENDEGYVNFADGVLTRQDFRELLFEGARADRTHIFIDACKSYFLVAGRGPGGHRQPYARPFALPDVTEGVGYILSTSNDSESHEWGAISSGVFSHEIRSALLGSADIDSDGAVDYEELAAFVEVANEGISNPQYRPDFYIRPPTGDLRAPILPYRALPSTSPLRVDASEHGRLSITDDERGIRYADAYKGAGARLELALMVPRQYHIMWNDHAFTVRATGQAVELASLVPDSTPSESQVSSKGAEGDRAFRNIFTTALDPNVLRGFRLGRAGALQLAMPPPPSASGPPSWVLPTLLAASVVGLGSGLTLQSLAGDEFDRADTGPQLERTNHEVRGNGYTWGAVGVYTLAASAAVTAAWFYLTSE